MNSILTVTTARADEGRLVALDALKTELNITATDTDDYFNASLIRATDAVEQYCDRVFAVETVSEVFRSDGCGWPKALILARYPTISLTSVNVDGTVLDEDYDYEIDQSTGLLYRLSSDQRICWSGSKIVTAYSAGFEVIPGPVQQGVFELVKLNQASRTRDPALRSENILEGLYSYTLFNGENMKSVLDAVTGLDRYINRRTMVA